MELLLWPYGNTAALQGPTALGKGVERSRGAFSLPFANHTQGTVDGCCWGRRLPVLAQPSWLQSNLHLHRFSPPWATNTPGQEGFCTDCSWTCTWHCRSQSTFNVPQIGVGQGVLQGFRAVQSHPWWLWDLCWTWKQQGCSWSATALSRFAEHSVSVMC